VRCAPPLTANESRETTETWDTLGTPLGHPWDTLGTPLGHPWDTLGTPLGHPWDTLGTPAARGPLAPQGNHITNHPFRSIERHGTALANGPSAAAFGRRCPGRVEASWLRRGKGDEGREGDGGRAPGAAQGPKAVGPGRGSGLPPKEGRRLGGSRWSSSSQPGCSSRHCVVLGARARGHAWSVDVWTRRRGWTAWRAGGPWSWRPAVRSDPRDAGRGAPHWRREWRCSMGRGSRSASSGCARVCGPRSGDCGEVSCHRFTHL